MLYANVRNKILEKVYFNRHRDQYDGVIRKINKSLYISVDGQTLIQIEEFKYNYSSWYRDGSKAPYKVGCYRCGNYASDFKSELRRHNKFHDVPAYKICYNLYKEEFCREYEADYDYRLPVLTLFIMFVLYEAYKNIKNMRRFRWC